MCWARKLLDAGAVDEDAAHDMVNRPDDKPPADLVLYIGLLSDQSTLRIAPNFELRVVMEVGL